MKTCALQCNECSSLSIRLFFLYLLFSFSASYLHDWMYWPKYGEFMRESSFGIFWKKKPYFNEYCYPLFMIAFEFVYKFLNLLYQKKAVVERERVFLLYIYIYIDNKIESNKLGKVAASWRHEHIGMLAEFLLQFFMHYCFFW